MDPRSRTAWAFGEEMKPCPKCKSYHIRYQTPVDCGLESGDNAKQILSKWARATKAGSTPLKGPVFIMCCDCGHCGPAVDCKGRTAEEVGRDPMVAAAVRRLWNSE
jgi:hypothetical protein